MRGGKDGDGARRQDVRVGEARPELLRVVIQVHRELPREVGGVARPGGEALPGERRHEVRSVAGEQDAPDAPLLGVAGVERVDGVALEAGIAGVDVPRAEQLPGSLFVVQLVAFFGGLHGLVSCSDWTGVPLAALLEARTAREL